MTKRAIFRLLLIVIVVTAAFFIYRFFFVQSGPTEMPGVEPLSASTRGSSGADDEFFKLLERLQDIELSTAETVFNHPVWENLENFRRELGTEPHRRRNPFAVTGFDISATTTLPSTSNR